MIKIELRDYQQYDVHRVREAMKNHRRILLQEPTGAGKTVIAAYMTQTAAAKGKRVYFICHRQELIEQTAKTFGKFGITTGVIWANAPALHHLPVQVCGIDTLKNRLDKIIPPDLVIWDESHHAAAAGWSRIMDRWKDAWHIGLSATPTRLDGKGLDDHFDILIPGKQTADLIMMGNLSRYRFFQPSRIDTSALHIKMGEYVKQESADMMDTSKIHGDIVEHYKKQANGLRAIAFAVTVAHSKHMAEAFRAAGIRAIHLDGETPRQERKLAARAFANGDIQVITNVGLFGEGYDLAAQADMDVTVDCVIDAQPTNSLAWCLQKWGRCLRPKPNDGKAIILDHAANVLRHGLPDDYREWSLQGIDKQQRKKTEEEVAIKTRQCPTCYAIHRPMPICPECGFLYEIKGREIEHVEGDLAEIDLEAMRRQQRAQQGKAQDVASLVAIGKSHGQAAHILAARAEKDRLRMTLSNLIRGAKMKNLDYQFTTSQIRDMKPKELGQWIEKIGQDIFMTEDFGRVAR